MPGQQKRKRRTVLLAPRANPLRGDSVAAIIAHLGTISDPARNEVEWKLQEIAIDYQHFREHDEGPTARDYIAVLDEGISAFEAAGRWCDQTDIHLKSMVAIAASERGCVPFRVTEWRADSAKQVAALRDAKRAYQNEIRPGRRPDTILAPTVAMLMQLFEAMTDQQVTDSFKEQEPRSPGTRFLCEFFRCVDGRITPAAIRRALRAVKEKPAKG